MWQVAEAKNKFSEPITRALTEGPQRVRRRGDTVVVISETEYDRLAGSRPEPETTFADLLMSGPCFEGIDLERRRSPMRAVDVE